MKVVLTGAGGGVGTIIRQMAPAHSGVQLTACSRQELNILDEDAVLQFISSQNPDYVINAAAFTNVDLAQAEPEAAYRLNSDCLEGMVKACRKAGAALIHLSTDYVFDGSKSAPYTEEDLPAPVNIYGASKLEGEQKVLTYPEGIVVRTSWVYSRYSRNFLAAIPGLLRSGSGPLYVDTIQVNSPTYGPDLVNALFLLMKNDIRSGLYHYTNSGGGCTRYDFACRIREKIVCKEPETRPVPVLPMQAETSAAAPRPAYSVMSPEKIGMLPGMKIPHWQEGIENLI